VFSFGTTQVTYTATDPTGNAVTCSFNVIVKDTQAPVIVGCPSDITIEAQASCQATVPWTAPSASDNCSYTLSATHAPGTVFSAGTTLVTYTATDPEGNSSTCSFNVTVKDTQAPVIVGCPSDITIEAQASCQVTAFWTPPSASDNCSATFSTSHAPGTAFSFGTTQVTYTATDPAGNSSTCSFNLIVRDTQAPVIDCPQDIIVEAQAACQAIVSWALPPVSDNCSAILSSTHDPGALFSFGTTQVTYTATDPQGNSSTCSFNVIVRDTQAPVITGCPQDITVEAQASCQATVSWTVPSVSDNCSATFNSTHTPGEVFSIGTTSVTYTATDPEGHSSVCSFNVNVRDTQAPVIAGCPQDITMTTDACEAAVSWTAPTTTDHCGATLTASHQSGNAFQLGTTTVTYTATDGTGLTSTCSFKVTVSTGKAPALEGCPEDITVHTFDQSAPVMWDAPQGTPACGALVVNASHQPGIAFSTGVTEVVYEFEDATGNKASCSFHVTVIHDEVTFEVSKAVTPNGDGINDTWWLTDIEKFNDNVVTVTDRWGNRIYQSSGYDNVGVLWSGLGPGGNKVPVGTYFYTVEVRAHESIVRQKGFVEVIY
jgi:gliding motility-associated-like protein